MSILANPIQSTIFLPPNSNDDLIALTGTQGNPAGYGTSQIVQFNTPITLPIGAVIPIQITAPKPAPLWAISTETAADRLVIRTINNQQIQLQTPTTINGTLTGFNNGYFQPAASQTYIFYFIAGSAKAANSQCFELQAVTENTIGQYIDLGSVTTTIRPSSLPSKSTYTIGTTVSLNTTSTLANTIYIDFSNWPVNAGLNVLATGIALLSAQANKSISAAFTNNSGSSWMPIQIVAGQSIPFEMHSQRDGYFTGRISIAISQVGVVTLSPTIPCTAISQMFEARYTMAGDNSATSQDVDSSRLLSAIEMLSTKVSSMACQLEDSDDQGNSGAISNLHSVFNEMQRKNESAHMEIFRLLGKLIKKTGLSDNDDAQTLNNEPLKTMNDSNMNLVSDAAQERVSRLAHRFS